MEKHIYTVFTFTLSVQSVSYVTMATVAEAEEFKSTIQIVTDSKVCKVTTLRSMQGRKMKRKFR